MELQSNSTNSHSAANATRDARRSVRYSLRAKVVLSWVDQRGHGRALRAHTRDVSVKGAYVLAPECPPSGTLVSIDIYLPAQPDEHRFIQVKAEGIVLRVDPAGRTSSEPGFAIHNKRVLICEK